jgi:hypothetical protein
MGHKGKRQTSMVSGSSWICFGRSLGRIRFHFPRTDWVLSLPVLMPTEEEERPCTHGAHGQVGSRKITLIRIAFSKFSIRQQCLCMTSEIGLRGVFASSQF